MSAEAKDIMAFVPSGKDYAGEVELYKTLGFTATWSSPELTVFRIGKLGFYLQNFTHEALQHNFMMDLAVEDLDGWWGKVEAAKLPERFPGTRIKAPETYPWGKREIHLITPAGVLWHISASA